MLESIPIWLHITAAAAWVGSQLLMFAVVVPSLRALPEESRVVLMERLTPRFAWFGYIALGILILTGIDNIRQYAPPDVFDIRYGYILSVKLTMLGVVLVLTLIHTQVVGPALLRLQRQAIQNSIEVDESQLRRTRGRSIALSASTLLLSLVTVFAAVLLRSPFGYAPV
jgi:copper resistance protein D